MKTLLAFILLATFTAKADMPAAIAAANAAGVKDTGSIVRWLGECASTDSSNVTTITIRPVAAYEARLLALTASYGVTNIVPGCLPTITANWRTAITNATDDVQRAAIISDGVEMGNLRVQLIQLGSDVYGITGQFSVTNTVSVSWCTQRQWERFGLPHAPNGWEVEHP